MEENFATQLEEMPKPIPEWLSWESFDKEMSARAEPHQPEEDIFWNNMPWWENEENITHKWAITFIEDANISGQTYSSESDNEHSILVTQWTITISDAIITKSWDAEWDSADFYWTNAATITTNGILELNNVNITTDGTHANAVFAYWDGELIISDSTIVTKNDNSWWIMVTWWWRLTSKNTTVTTNWNSSAAIRSDRWWWNIYVEGWNYTTNWIWSPAIYSTADITVDWAQLLSTKSEWAIVEWKNNITILNSTLVDSNTTLNWQSTTYKNIFLYQSMSGDAEEWTTSFTAKDSKIITNNGDSIYVTNTTAEILLQNNEIINTSWDFLRIEASSRWREWYNWWDVSLNLINQKVEWNIIVDKISSLTMNLTENSNFIWAINSTNESQNIIVRLDNNSTWTLNSDSYISKIQTDTTWYSNINLNGHTLYIWEEAITSTNRLSEEEILTTTTNLDQEEWFSTTDMILWCFWVIAIILALCMCIATYFRKK